MNIEEHVLLAKKTTMRIGGRARFYAELCSKKEVEEVSQFAKDKRIPLIVLGGGSNTIFADEMIDGIVVRVKHDQRECSSLSAGFAAPDRLSVGAGRILASFINECAENDLDLSPLTGIPGTVGGAVFGNAGQGPQGIWTDSFVESVEVFHDEKWNVFSHKECMFSYRDSVFKKLLSPIIWQTTLRLPIKSSADIKNEVERLIQKRIETQPHLKTAGSCFKAIDGKPAWKLIDAAGLRGRRIGDIQIAEKHANFLLNIGSGTFEDAVKLVTEIKTTVPDNLDIEMRFIRSDGVCVF